ncbi:hypothetical protein SADUNF_Sadunf09G0113100 [Salix dunnii]|uniref:Uncharacterized protein n=1 Tax=Salix dunnii TaxID=1413687 RepID=A0A835JVZ4_9ROSI|nr:hypothetical protein SADUNF_Sadunf09G0113100 [Salix dunnii]
MSRCINAVVSKRGFLRARLLSSYTRPHSSAQDLNLYEFNKKISNLEKHGQIDEARALFDQMEETNTVSWNAVIRGYVKRREIAKARKLFDEMPHRDIVSWNLMISGYVSCHGTRFLKEGRNLFDRMPERDIVSWNTMISGYAKNGRMDEALRMFKLMPEGDVVSWNAIITGFLQNGDVARAIEYFEKMPERDAASLSALVSGLIRNGELDEAARVVVTFERDGGREENLLQAYNTLIAGYGRRDRVDEARKLFDQIPFCDDKGNGGDGKFGRNVVSWNTMIIESQNFHDSTRLDPLDSPSCQLTNRTQMMQKRRKTDLEQAVVNVWKRELGQLSTRNFAHRLAASVDLVLRLEIHKKLEKHDGCVNTLSFNESGDVLVSGSDDLRVILWDWETGRVKLSFYSGHRNNVFQAKFLPISDDRTIVTCAADGEIRQAQILEGGEVKTVLLGKHEDSRVHKLAIEPGNPHILYSCGEDGVVQHFDLRTRSATKLFTCRSINGPRSYRPYVHLNAIAIDPRNPNLFAVGGLDEFARLYDIRKYTWDGSSDFGQPADYFCPQHLIGNEDTGITGLSFSDQSELLVSYNNEFIYLFTRDMGLGNPPFPSFSPPISKGSDTSEVEPGTIASSSSTGVDGKNVAQAYKGHRNFETVKGVSFFGPRCEYVSSGSDCGRIFIWKKRSGELIRVMEADRDVVNCTEPHPHTMALASSGIESDIKIWTPKAIERATLPTDIGQRKPKARGWMHRLASPEDLMLQLFSLQRQRTSPESVVQNSVMDTELLELILSFNANSDVSSDDGGDTANHDDLLG